MNSTAQEIPLPYAAKQLLERMKDESFNPLSGENILATKAALPIPLDRLELSKFDPESGVFIHGWVGHRPVFTWIGFDGSYGYVDVSPFGNGVTHSLTKPSIWQVIKERSKRAWNAIRGVDDD